MDFKQAVEWHEKGEDVFRDNTDLNHLTWKSDENELKFYNKSEDSSYNFDLEDFKATDWQLCVEEITWNLMDEICKGIYQTEDVDYWKYGSIRTLKEKIQDDIQKKSHWGSDGESEQRVVSVCHVDDILTKRMGF